MIINLNAISWLSLSTDKKSVDVRMQDGRHFTSTEHFWALYMLLAHEEVPYSIRKLAEGVYLVQPFK